MLHVPVELLEASDRLQPNEPDVNVGLAHETVSDRGAVEKVVGVPAVAVAPTGRPAPNDVQRYGVDADAPSPLHVLQVTASLFEATASEQVNELATNAGDVQAILSVPLPVTVIFTPL